MFSASGKNIIGLFLLLFGWLPASFAGDAQLIPFHLEQEGPGKSLAPAVLNNQVEEILFRETNQRRSQKKLSELKPQEILKKVALDHSQDMLKRNYLSHFSPEHRSVLERMQKYVPRIQTGLGENIHTIFSSRGLKDPQAIADQMMDDWMGSPSHRKNIVSKNFVYLGVSCASDGKKIFCTQVFSGANL